MTARIDAVLRSAVDSGAMPNVVGVAANDTGVLYEGAAGPRAVGGSDAVNADSIFRIGSMTKMVCTVAALQQRDCGNLDFDAPVDSYCPAFAAVEVLEGFDDGRPRTRTSTRRATVRQLVNHTTGLAYGFWNADLARWEAATAAGDVFSAPMVADPGTRFEYGISTDWLGRVVEAVSGLSLDRYFTEHVFDPLGMRSTAFQLNDERRAVCVPVHDRDESGSWVPTDRDWDQEPAWWPGGHGLYSTPRDYLLFQRMLLGGGTLAGTTVLARSSVREMFTNQIGDLWFPPEIRTVDPEASCDFVAGPGMKWGWGLLLDTHGRPGGRSSGSGGWIGVFNTGFWIDPVAGITGALYSQFRPLGTPEALKTCAEFERAVYSDH